MANSQFIYISDPIFVYQDEQISTFQNDQLGVYTTGSIVSTLTFSVDNSLNRFVTFTLDNQETFSTDAEVTHTIILPSIVSTLTFGDEEQFKLNLSIVDQGVVSTESFGTANVFYSIGPESTESTISFGLPVRQNPVHRSLIYKNDNITKLGTEDDVEIASGIVIQTSTAKLTGNTVPGAAAGYIKVTIDGTDYSMPFFEIPEQ